MPTNENLIQESWTNDGIINLLCFFYDDIDTKFPLFVNDLRQGTCEEYKMDSSLSIEFFHTRKLGINPLTKYL